MAVPKRKVSKMKRRQRQAHNRYEGVQATLRRAFRAAHRLQTLRNL